MLRITFLLFVSLFISASAIASELKATLTVENTTNEINDGEARVAVQGGVPPYTFKWSEEKVKLTSDLAKGLTEGEEFSVLITDSLGQSLNMTGIVPAKSGPEYINSYVKPVVGVMSNLLFWDPFSAIGIYDPVV